MSLVQIKLLFIKLDIKHSIPNIFIHINFKISLSPRTIIITASVRSLSTKDIRDEKIIFLNYNLSMGFSPCKIGCLTAVI